MKTICTYDDFGVVEINGTEYAIHNEGFITPVIRVSDVPYPTHTEIDENVLLDMCSKYDISGELDDLSAYVFWEYAGADCNWKEVMI